MIAFNNLVVKHGNKTILDNVTYDIYDKNIEVLIGLNGSGKTTLLESIFKFNKKMQGSISIDGKSLRDITPKQRASLISFNLQSRPLVLYNVYELIKEARYPYGSLFKALGDEDYQAINNAIEFTGINELLDKNVNQLSGGERQMVYLTQTLAQNTKYIVLDEPTNNLDTLNKKKLFEIIRKMKKNGHTVIVVLHDLREALEIADRITILNDGKNVGSISKDEFKKSTLIEDTFNLKKYEVLLDNKIEYIYK